MTNDQLADTLANIAARWGTPCYAYDLDRLCEQVDRLRTHLPESVAVFYSLKANASLGISQVFAGLGLGADVASDGELHTALEAGFAPERMFVAGPYKGCESIEWLRMHPQAIVSVDSPFELQQLAQQGLRNRAVLRLRPDFESGAVVAAGPDSRFGFPLPGLPDVRKQLAASSLRAVGFHIYAGSQVLDASTAIRHLDGALRLARRAAVMLDVPLEWVNLGGGFGIPYARDESELDLEVVGSELRLLSGQLPTVQLALELGRYLVAPAGWYLTRVVGYQTYAGRAAVVVDGGTHQRADLCGLCLRTRAAPPLVLNRPGSLPRAPIDILGALSLPADVLAQECPLPDLEPGDVLAFANSGAYGLWASATHFHGYPLPAEIAFDRHRRYVLREPQEARSVLVGQQGIPADAWAAHGAVRPPTPKKEPRTVTQ